MDSFGPVLDRLRAVNYTDIIPMAKVSGAVRAKIAAIISDVRERISQKGNRFAFITGSDKSGSFDLLCFSDVLTANRDKLKSGQPLLLTVNATRKEGEEDVRLNLAEVEYLADVMANTATTLIVNLEKVEAVQEIKKVLTKVPAGKSKIFLILKTTDYNVEFELPTHYTITPDVIDNLSRISGVQEVKQA